MFSLSDLIRATLYRTRHMPDFLGNGDIQTAAQVFYGITPESNLINNVLRSKRFRQATLADERLWESAQTLYDECDSDLELCKLLLRAIHTHEHAATSRDVNGGQKTWRWAGSGGRLKNGALR